MLQCIFKNLPSFVFDILNEVALHICADDSILMEIFEKVNGELDGH
jgi:hypothetical protein